MPAAAEAAPAAAAPSMSAAAAAMPEAAGPAHDMPVVRVRHNSVTAPAEWAVFTRLFFMFLPSSLYLSPLAPHRLILYPSVGRSRLGFCPPPEEEGKGKTTRLLKAPKLKNTTTYPQNIKDEAATKQGKFQAFNLWLECNKDPTKLTQKIQLKITARDRGEAAIASVLDPCESNQQGVH
eukprot:2891183-Pyramimonas_sp.AAC.1